MAAIFLGPVLDLVHGVIDKIWPDANTREKAKADAAMALMKGEFDNELAQISVNAAEAKSDKLFVAGWRPFIGWVCGSAFAYHFIFQPFVVFILKVLHVAVPDMPVLSMGDLMPVLLGMLGLGGLRTYEKIQGANGTKVKA